MGKCLKLLINGLYLFNIILFYITSFFFDWQSRFYSTSLSILTSLYPVRVILPSSSCLPSPTTCSCPKSDLANFSAMVDLPTMYFLQVGQQVMAGFFLQNSHTGCPSLHCQILQSKTFHGCSRIFGYSFFVVLTS